MSGDRTPLFSDPEVWFRALLPGESVGPEPRLAPEHRGFQPFALPAPTQQRQLHKTVILIHFLTL